MCAASGGPCGELNAKNRVLKLAIYHASAKVIKRSAGRSSTAAAAYRAGERIKDERTNEVHDYTRKSGVDHSEILAPKGSPDWVYDRSRLWNEVEKAEKRKDAQVAREFEVAIPKELPPDQAREMVRAFVQEQFVDRGMVADICHHHSEGENPHAHILLTMREIGPDGFGQKQREWNRPEVLQAWRQSWEDHANSALARAGSRERIDSRSLEAQGVDREPQIHHQNRPIRVERNEEIKRSNIQRLMAKIASAYKTLRSHVSQAIRPTSYSEVTKNDPENELRAISADAEKIARGQTPEDGGAVSEAVENGSEDRISDIDRELDELDRRLERPAAQYGFEGDEPEESEEPEESDEYEDEYQNEYKDEYGDQHRAARSSPGPDSENGPNSSPGADSGGE